MINVPIGELLDTLEEQMLTAEEAMKKDFAGFRTGKASPALVENIMVEYYGAMTRIREIAGINTPEPRMLVIQPWDPSAVGAIEKAIQVSGLGISPVSDGRVVRLPIPELSEERRASLAKQVKTRAEDARVSIRNIRREGNEAAKKAQKNSELTEDELKGLLEKIQKLTDDYIGAVDADTAEKEKELMKL
jgi:ribosome recycling factor